MLASSHRKSIAFFIVLGALLVALAVALNVGWVLLNWREVALLVFGVIFFCLIIAGLVLNTIFLVREIRRNEQHDSFINAVTHELKTPITSIRLYLETLQTREVSEEKRREFYQIVLEDTDRLLRTVEQVLRAGQAGHRKREHHKSLIDLGELIKECLSLTRTRSHLNEDAIEYRELLPAGVRPMVIGDQDELIAAISNLVDNAIKYSDKNIHVVVEMKLQEKLIVVRVMDSGIGIPQEQLNRVFGRFYRVPHLLSAKIKGTGLGLFIVRSVIKRHGGRVFAESEGEGYGSTFTIELPRFTEAKASRAAL
jgi:two-component system, OmpR family, sensor histidine kinase SenX3